MTRAVVTGGAGFLGSHLVDALVARGDEVVVVDDLSTGSPRNLAQLEDNPQLTVRHLDITTAPLTELIQGAVDVVLHFASRASPRQYLDAPLHTLRTGSAGTDHALALADDRGARFLLASTSEVYGDALVHPQPENYWGNVNPVGPRSCYDEAKRYAEAVTMAYQRALGTDVAIARIFNTYGPRLDPGDGRVVSNLLVQALRGDALTVYGDGRQTRSFCYVEDEVRGLLALLDSTLTGPVNIGNPAELTVLELAEAVLEATGSRSAVVHAPLPVDDPRQRRPDITLARDALGWEPVVPLTEGLARTIAWLRERS